MHVLQRCQKPTTIKCNEAKAQNFSFIDSRLAFLLVPGIVETYGWQVLIHEELVGVVRGSEVLGEIENPKTAVQSIEA